MNTTEATETRYQCRHIFTDGRRCASPSLRREHLCYYHHTTRRPIPAADQRRRRTNITRHTAFDLPVTDINEPHRPPTHLPSSTPSADSPPTRSIPAAPASSSTASPSPPPTCRAQPPSPTPAPQNSWKRSPRTPPQALRPLAPRRRVEPEPSTL